MNTHSPHIAKAITDLRISLGISLEKAANALGISMFSMARIESGSHSISTAEISILAKLYGVPVSKLFESSSGPAVDRSEMDRLFAESPLIAYTLGLISIGKYREITGMDPDL